MISLLAFLLSFVCIGLHSIFKSRCYEEIIFKFVCEQQTSFYARFTGVMWPAGFY